MLARVCDRCKHVLGEEDGVHINEIRTAKQGIVLLKDGDLCGKCYDEFVINFLKNSEMDE